MRKDVWKRVEQTILAQKWVGKAAVTGLFLIKHHKQRHNHTNEVSADPARFSEKPPPRLNSLTKRPGNDVHLVHDAIAISNAAPSGAVQAHSVNLVHEGDRAKLVSDVTHLLERTHSTYESRIQGSLGA